MQILTCRTRGSAPATARPVASGTPQARAASRAQRGRPPTVWWASTLLPFARPATVAATPCRAQLHVCQVIARPLASAVLQAPRQRAHHACRAESTSSPTLQRAACESASRAQKRPHQHLALPFASARRALTVTMASLPACPAPTHSNRPPRRAPRRRRTAPSTRRAP